MLRIGTHRDASANTAESGRPRQARGEVCAEHTLRHTIPHRWRMRQDPATRRHSSPLDAFGGHERPAAASSSRHQFRHQRTVRNRDLGGSCPWGSSQKPPDRKSGATRCRAAEADRPTPKGPARATGIAGRIRGTGGSERGRADCTCAVSSIRRKGSATARTVRMPPPRLRPLSAARASARVVRSAESLCAAPQQPPLVVRFPPHART